MAKIVALFDQANAECASYMRPLKFYFKKAGYDLEVLKKEESDKKSYDIIVKSHFGEKLSDYYTSGKPHIYISYKRYDVPPNDNVPYCLRFTNRYIEEERKNEEIIYLPYVSNFMKKVKYDNFSSTREYVLAYCSSNKVLIRETSFDVFVSVLGHDNCISLGDCYGSFEGTNIKLDGNHTSKGLSRVLSEFKFMMCFENGDVPGYITEKIMLAYRSGCIPVYWGTDAVSNYFNEKSFINVKKFETVEECAKYVSSLSNRAIDRMRMQPMFKGENGVLTNVPPRELSISNASDHNIEKFTMWASQLITKPITIR